MDEKLLIDNKWYETELRNNGGCFGFALYIVIVSLLVFMCSSCTTTRVEYRDRYIDNYITQVVHDTLREQTSDSVYYEVVIRHDTVFSTKYKERTKWRDRIVERTDTCWRDSVVTEYKEVTKEVVKIPKIYQYSLFFSIFVVIFVAIKLYRKFRVV